MKMLEGTCLLCFAVNRRTIDILNTHLQKVYEKIAGFKIKHTSLCLCFICHQRLQQCQQLWRLAEQTQSVLKNFQSISKLQTQNSLIELSTVNVMNLSISVHDHEIKQEPDVKEEDQHIKDDTENVGIEYNDENEKTEETIKSSDSEDDVPLNNIIKEQEVDAERNKTEVDTTENKDTADPTKFVKTSNASCKVSLRPRFISIDVRASNDEYVNNIDKGNAVKIIRTKDHCFFCKLNVLNFARHIFRNHITEPEVQRIMNCPKKSCTRKKLLMELRKKGNFLKNIVQCDKPMRKSLHVDYIPCVNCLGFYSRRTLWKHKKICQPLKQTANTQVEAENLIFRDLNIDKKLMDEVFPKMRPDKISLQVQRDMLICAFGAQYLKSHHSSSQHNVSVTSRKMRELAKLVLELNTLEPSIKNLMDGLKSKNYDLIVKATKKTSSYSDITNRYGSPSYAMNIMTSLKLCCNIVILTTLKSDRSMETAPVRSDLKMLIHRIENNWKFDVSSHAGIDLQLKKQNKITMVSLAKDLKLLKNYLCEKSESAATKLRESETNNIEAYNTLLETVYCRILLLNKLSPGELQRLSLRIYQENNNDSSSHEEFDGAAVSSVKKMLIKIFKRIVTRGKGCGGAPVLLTDEVQNDIDLLISVRRNYVSDIKLEAQEITLSEEEQKREFLQRAASTNYACSPYKCGLCYRGFVHPAAYHKHREKHDERSGAHACTICQLRYASARQLRAHVASAHARRYACPRCPHRAHTRNQAKEHEKWHRGHTYLCNLCGVKFSKPTTYLTHRRKRHAGASACKRCGEGFATPNGLRLHITKAHGHRSSTEAVEPSAESLCEECGIQFDNTTAWRRHVLTSDRHTIWNKHNDQCKVCGEAVDEAERRQHERAHARELGSRAEDKGPPLQLACEQCGVYATSKSNLRAHVRRVHLGLKYDKQLVCEVCGKNCTSNATLRYHQRRHTGERPYACACGARFADANQLRIHSRTHSGERPYACHLCQRRFAQKPALNKHYRVHTGAKPYECQFCKRSFSQTNSLKLHVRAVHLKLPPNNKKKIISIKIKKDNVEVINK